MTPEEERKFAIEQIKRKNSCTIGVSFCIESRKPQNPINIGTTTDLLRILGEKNE